MERMELPGRMLTVRASGRPRLLVSVRSREEVVAACEGGAEVLDVKEPSRGSLGMASLDEIQLIARCIADSSWSGLPLSVACGEVVDWRSQSPVPALPSGITFAKLGLSQLLRSDDWRSEWLRIRKRFEELSQSPLHWVAVAYADSDAAASPPVCDVLDAAIEAECSGVLIDTYAKNGLTLTNLCDASMLCRVAERCHSAGLFLALAGRLSRESLQQLSSVPADVLAIRSAACVGEDRTACLATSKVAAFREAMWRSMKPISAPYQDDSQFLNSELGSSPANSLHATTARNW